jgi:hypothetical protein
VYLIKLLQFVVFVIANSVYSAKAFRSEVTGFNNVYFCHNYVPLCLPGMHCHN